MSGEQKHFETKEHKTTGSYLTHTRVFLILSGVFVLYFLYKFFYISENQDYIIFVLILCAMVYLFINRTQVSEHTVALKDEKNLHTQKSDFIAMASEELRTPIARMVGYIELLRDEDTLSETQEEYLFNIESSTQRLNAIVDNMIDTTLLEQGKLSLDRRDVNVEEIISGVVVRTKELVGERDITIKQERLKEIVLHTDAKRVTQALNNILTLLIRLSKKDIVRIRYQPKQKKLEISIISEAFRLSMSEKERLFDRFNRLRSHETNQVISTGLGLWLSREIIRKLGGDITVNLYKQKGTQFIVSLPIGT